MARHFRGIIMTNYTDILNNPNFQRLAACLRVASRPAWLQAHPASKFGFHFNNFVRLSHTASPDLRGNLIAAYSGMTVSIAEVDSNLSRYLTTEVLEWFVALLDGERQIAATTLSMLLAVAACEDTMLTPGEAAERTGMSDSHWRNAAAAGDIPGAQKRGNTWLIPQAWITVIEG